MEPWTWIAVGLVVVVVLLMVLARRVAGRVDPTQLLLEPDLVNRVRALAQADEKGAAIKLLREATPGLGLAPAKQMVDRMAASPKQPSPVADASGGDGRPSPDLLPSASPVPLEVELQARSLKSEGQADAAIDLVRDHTQWDSASAAIYVDKL